MSQNDNNLKEGELFLKYKSSYTLAFVDLFTHFFYLSCSMYLLWLYKDTYWNIFTILLQGLLTVKTFVIFHDCIHESYTPSKTLNYIIGNITGILTYSPYCWNYIHNTHHLTNGNTTNKYKFDSNELIIFSLKEYQTMSPMKKLSIKILYHPLFLFFIAGFLKFFVFGRIYILLFYFNQFHYNPSTSFLLLDQLINNVGVSSMLYLAHQYSMLWQFVLSFLCSTTAGTLLFFHQHTYNPPYVVKNEDWNMKDSGLKGSSFIQIPFYLTYFTGKIEYHHIHHMNSKIPNYNLRKYHEEVISKSNMFDHIVKLSMTDCMNNIWLSLYDESTNKYITFQEADKRMKMD